MKTEINRHVYYTEIINEFSELLTSEEIEAKIDIHESGDITVANQYFIVNCLVDTPNEMLVSFDVDQCSHSTAAYFASTITDRFKDFEVLIGASYCVVFGEDGEILGLAYEDDDFTTIH